MVDGISDELVRRMANLIRERVQIADGYVILTAQDEHRLHSEARNIVAELPPPVDPDLLLAREVAASFYTASDVIIRGCSDDCIGVAAALAAIRRVREQSK